MERKEIKGQHGKYYRYPGKPVLEPKAEKPNPVKAAVDRFMRHNFMWEFAPEVG